VPFVLGSDCISSATVATLTRQLLAKWWGIMHMLRIQPTLTMTVKVDVALKADVPGLRLLFVIASPRGFFLVETIPKVF